MSVSVEIRVVEEVGIPTDTVTDSEGRTPPIELPPLLTGVVQKFIVNLVDCLLQELLRNRDVTITPTINPDTGKIESVVITSTGYRTRVVTELIEQTLTIPMGLITVQIILYTATDGPLTTVTIPDLGVVKVGTICLDEKTPQIKVWEAVKVTNPEELPPQPDLGGTLIEFTPDKGLEKRLIIENIGTKDLEITSIILEKVGKPFKLIGGFKARKFPSRVAPGGIYGPLLIQCTSPSIVPSENTLIIKSNDPFRPEVKVHLRCYK